MTFASERHAFVGARKTKKGEGTSSRKNHLLPSSRGEEEGQAGGSRNKGEAVTLEREMFFSNSSEGRVG